MNCINCGKELAEGEICTCTNDIKEAPVEVAAEPVAEATEPVAEAEAPSVAEPVQPQEQAPATPEQPSFNPYEQPSYYAPEQQQQPYYVPAGQPMYYAPAPTQKPEPSTSYPEGYKIKKKYVAILLAFFLGPLGIHNFYLGRSGRAIAQLLLSTVGCLALVGPIVSAVWAVVEMVLLLVDSDTADAEGYKIQTFAEELAKAQSKD